MHFRLLIFLILSILLITANSNAEEALNEVRIMEGIVQQRPPNTRQIIGKRYVWNFKGKSYTALMTIDVEKYNSYDGKERFDIPKLVEEGRTSIGNLTREFQNIFRRRSEWSERDRIDFVLSFVQSLPYTFDDVTTGYDEFRRYAIETLIDGGGDCEDTTILVAAILRGLGVETALIFTPGHIALGVSGNFTGTSVTYNGTKYYYCETTGTGFTVGELPPSFSTNVTRIVPLTPSRIAPVPQPDRTVRPIPSTFVPSPEITTPTPETPPIETTTPETQSDTKSKSRLGTAIVLIFILIALGISTVHF
ncbi:transglutaminase domain-containing protein, partial [Candidatus Poribacteria bacterium]|nr:transglutaminase domain-containing protein [Candidatus Poribacteria bacterium]